MIRIGSNSCPYLDNGQCVINVRKGFLLLKILLATNWEMRQSGGITTYLRQMTRGFTRRGHKVDLLTRQVGSHDFKFNGEKIFTNDFVVRRVDVSSNNRLEIENSKIDGKPIVQAMKIERLSFAWVAKQLDLSHYDILHAQDAIAVQALSEVRPPGVPLVSTFHGSLSRENVPGKYHPLAPYYAEQEYHGVVCTDKTIVPSQWMRRFLTSEYAIPDDQFVTIPYGIDSESLLYRAKQTPHLQPPPDKKVILCPARLSPVKGQTVLMRALAKLKQQRQDWVCWLVGGGPLLTLLKNQRRILALDQHVMFLGETADVPALLNLADVAVLPSLQDNQPFAIMEAQIVGKAIVTTDAGGIPEMVSHGKTALLAIAGNSDSLYENLLQLLSDKDLRRTLARNSKQEGRLRWSLETALNRTEKLYHDVCS